MKYTFNKFKYNKNKISYIQIYFDNGDFFTIKGSEIVDLSIKVYDKLIKHDKGVFPVAESGFTKLNILNNIKFIYNDYSLYNEDEYKKDYKIT